MDAGTTYAREASPQPVPINGNGELLRIFSVRSLCAMAVVLPGVWAFAASSLTIGIFGGGPPVEVWGSLVVGLAISIMCLSLAEFSSAFPSAAGCTHIAFQLAGPKHGRLAGYLTGSFHSFGVLFTPAALVIFLAQMVVTCAELFHDDYTATRWQVFLVYQVYCFAFVLVIVYGTRALPLINQIGIYFLLGGLFVTIGVLLGLSPSIAPSNVVWFDVFNGSGFDSDAMGILIGLLGPIYAYGPPHWLLNMAEDVQNPGRSIPIALGAQQIGNIISLFAFYVAGYYAVPDFNSLIESTMTSIVGAVYLQVTERPNVALVLLLIILVPSTFATVSYMSANIRLLYGFVRGGPLPYVHWWAKINERFDIPLNVLYVFAFVNFLLGFVYLASASGFAIIIGSTFAFYSIGYLPMLIPMVLNGRKYMRPGQFSLSWPVGMACGIFSTFLQLFILIMSCFPTSGPVSLETMNWAVLFVIVAGVGIALGWVFHGRHHYLGSDIQLGFTHGVNLAEVSHEGIDGIDIEKRASS